MKFSAQPPPAFFFKQALPRLGLGTWSMGESRARRTAEVAAVRNAMRLGYRLIDTAEMYGDGGAEEVVGNALAEALQAGEVARSDLLIVSKVYPHNASHSGTWRPASAACSGWACSAWTCACCTGVASFPWPKPVLPCTHWCSKGALAAGA